MIDRLPPQNLEVEKYVLGALLLESQGYDSVRFLTPEMFYNEKHYHVFDAIQKLKSKREPVDLATVGFYLHKANRLNEIGPVYLSELCNGIGSAAHIEAHGKILRDTWAKRAAINLFTKLQRTCYADDVEIGKLLSQAQKELAEIQSAFFTGQDVKHISQVLKEASEQQQHKQALVQSGMSTGLNTGIFEVNQITGGWQNTDFVVIGARPSMGKTAYGLGVAKAAAKSGVPGLFFSLEMSNIQLADRMVISDAEVSSTKYRDGRLDNNEINQVFDVRKELEPLGIYVDETAGIELTELLSKARRLKQMQNIGWILIDHLTLIRCRDFYKDKRREVSEVSRTLKELAKELKLPVIALCQLSRAVETRGGDMRPRLSDLRETGSIEEDADLVAFIHRPEYYGQTTDAEGNSTNGKAEIIFAKHRNGAVGTIHVRWIDRYAKFISVHGQPVSEQFPSTMKPNEQFLNNPF